MSHGMRPALRRQREVLVPPLQVALDVVLLRGPVVAVGAAVGPLPRVGPQVDGQLGGGLAMLATEPAAVVGPVVQVVIEIGERVRRRKGVRVRRREKRTEEVGAAGRFRK